MKNQNKFFIAEDLEVKQEKSNITVEDFEKFFNEKENSSGCHFAKIFYNDEDNEISILEELEGKIIKGDTKLKIRFSENTAQDSINFTSNKFKEDELIPYNMKYHEHSGRHFIQAIGDSTLRYIEHNTIEKQRAVLKHFLSKIGTNILSGNGIMNVSLPINIFDERSLLEVFAHQCRLAPYFLEKSYEAKTPLEKLKLTTAFNVSRLHLTVTQLKPFNPILGETFQCKIGDTLLYIEQTSHHPPVYNYLYLGKNFKSYGSQQPVASTGANSVSAYGDGVQIIEFSDGTIHKIYPSKLIIGGTIIGERTLAYVGQLCVTDEKNDLISFIEFNPEERGAISKFFYSKKTFPDYFKGSITKLSQTKFNAKEKSFSLNKNYSVISTITGEWTKFCYIESQLVWDINDYVHFDLLRMKFTLQSDSTLREDLILLKSKNEELAGEAKCKLEEIQRRDRKLRAKYNGNEH